MFVVIHSLDRSAERMHDCKADSHFDADVEEGFHSASVRSPVVDEERMRPLVETWGQWFMFPLVLSYCWSPACKSFVPAQTLVLPAMHWPV